MKLHSDVLSLSDLADAINSVDGAWIDEWSQHGSRKRARGFKVKLVGTSGRWVNSGQYGAGSEYAATWDQWGEFLAFLYKRDPNMVADYYLNAEHFHERTEGKFA